MPRPQNDPMNHPVAQSAISKKGKPQKDAPPVNPALTVVQPATEEHPEPPDWLGSTALEVWTRELPLLDLHPGKLQLFAAYCSHSGRAIEFEREINKKGRGKRLSNHLFQKAGEITAAAKEWKAASDLGTKLGITGLVKLAPPAPPPEPGAKAPTVETSQAERNAFYEGGSKPGN